jgi:hypothetical protein
MMSPDIVVSTKGIDVSLSYPWLEDQNTVTYYLLEFAVGGGFSRWLQTFIYKHCLHSG